MTILGLCWDHRALDGALAAQFLASVKRRTGGLYADGVNELWVCQLGTIEYREALALQERVSAPLARPGRARRDAAAGALPVYTRGRRSAPGELPMGEDWYRAQGIDIVDVDRGGKVTYHGPGQLVGYPIVASTMSSRTSARSRRRSWRARGRGRRRRPGPARDGPDYTGVWVGERKIASIGVHVARA